VTVGAGEALFETTDRLDLPETMADMTVTVSLTETVTAWRERACALL